MCLGSRPGDLAVDQVRLGDLGAYRAVRVQRGHVPGGTVISGESRSLTDTPRRRSPAVSQVRPPGPQSLQAVAAELVRIEPGYNVWHNATGPDADRRAGKKQIPGQRRFPRTGHSRRGVRPRRSPPSRAPDAVVHVREPLRVWRSFKSLSRQADRHRPSPARRLRDVEDPDRRV
jgi:hypothetical protein